jgi:hypothetical protein
LGNKRGRRQEDKESAYKVRFSSEILM